MTKSLTKLMRDPFDGLFPKDEVSLWRSLDDMWRDLPGFMDDGWSFSTFPRSDIIYEETKTTIELPLAGYSKDQLSIVMSGGTLIISATKCEDKGSSRRAARAFQRSFRIGDKHDADNISAEFVDGLLRVELPLLKDGKKEVQTITIK